jgi:Ca2+-binding EF-hand superfamily protein
MNELRYVIRSSNIDLERLFSSRGYSKNSELTLEDFKKFLSVVGLSFEPEEARYAFEKIDTDDSSTISLAELESTLMSHQIPLRSITTGPKFGKKASMNEEGVENHSMADEVQ